MKRTYIQFCPFCGKNEKIGYEGSRLRCYDCGRLFSVEELPLLRVSPFGFKLSAVARAKEMLKTT